MMKMNLQKINYQKELEKLLTRLEKEEKVPTLLLHSCCAPCSSYVLEYYHSILKSLSSIIIQIFIRKVNTQSASWNNRN